MQQKKYCMPLSHPDSTMETRCCMACQTFSSRNCSVYTAARILTRTKKCKHISRILRSLHWLPVSKRIDNIIMTLTYKCLHNLAPYYLQELIHPYEPSRSLRSSSQVLLHVPKTRLKTYGDRSFAKAAPTLWNSLPQNIRESESLEVFKTSLKTHLFSQG